MSPHANDTIRNLVAARKSSGGPEWAGGTLYVVELDYGDHLDASEPMPLPAARRRLVEIIDTDWPHAPGRDTTLAELRDGSTDLFADGRAYALTEDESVFGGIQIASQSAIDQAAGN